MAEVAALGLNAKEPLDLKVERAVVAFVAIIVLGLEDAFNLQDGEVAAHLDLLELDVGVAQAVG